ncbi:MAG: DUF2877 domain-containing protein [Eubacterium sp.]
MQTLFAKAVALELLPLLSDRKFAVHSCFDSGCNIIIDDRLCFIGNKKDHGLPYSLLIDQKEVRMLTENVIPGHTFLKWNTEKEAFETENVILVLKKAKCFDSRFLGDERALPENTLKRLMNNIDLRQKTGFGDTMETIINPKNKALENLYKSFKTEDKKEAETVLRKWMGLGMGLTPSGDDFLLGILFVNQINPFLGEIFLKTLKTLVDEQIYTTDISNHFYRCAFGHYFSQAFIRLYEAMILKSHTLLGKRTAEILAFGHTSGCDIVTGILAGLSKITGS